MLEVTGLSISFNRYHQGLQRNCFTPVSDITLAVHGGEIVAVVGASGSGKSLLAHALLGLLPANAHIAGTIKFKGEQLSQSRMRRLRGHEIALIPQSVAYLNPLIRVGSQVLRAARLSGQDTACARRNTDQVFARYSLKDQTKSLFPFQLSGGMARRVVTAAATVSRAELIIADEPTTGLDPVVAEKSLAHLHELAENGKGVVLITHDLAAAVKVAQRVVVVYAGKTVEITAATSFHQQEKLLHPYTKTLWQALPQNDFVALPGEQSHDEMRTGCMFASRCPVASALCETLAPELKQLNGSLVRCPHATC
jgi:peptide/nickel transport system ATP-binding protein